MSWKFDPLNGKKWPAVFIVSLLVATAVFYVWTRRDRISYGEPRHSYLQATILSTGQEVWVCYDAITWIAPAPSVIKQHFTCQVKKPGGDRTVATRFDLPIHTVPVPSEPKKLPPKCRRIESDGGVPQLVPSTCEPGPFKYGGQIEVSTRWHTLVYDLPANLSAQIVAK